MAEIILDAGTLEFSADDLTATGLLVPFGEECHSNLGRFSVDANSFEIPDDLTGMSLNVEHERERVVGAFTAASVQGAGIVATFKYSATPEGRSAFNEAQRGDRRHLSAEVSGVRIKDGKAIAGRLFAAAQVAKPAFPSATLLASDVDAEQDETEPETPSETSEALEPATPVDPEPERTTEVADTEVLNTLTASDSAAKKPLTAKQVFEIMERANVGDTTLLASLTEVPYDGTGGVGVDTVAPQWIGELWGDLAYRRQISNLLSHANLTATQVVGWKFDDEGLPTGGNWAGNGAAVTSGTVSVTPFTQGIHRFAGANSIAREHFDFNTPGFIEAFYRAQALGYEKWVDSLTATAILAGATALEADDPTGIAAGAAMSALIDGATEVFGNYYTPDFAVVGKGYWKQIAKTPQVNALAYLNAALDLDGTDSAIDEFRITVSPLLGDSDVLVGASAAATLYELSGVPIRANLANIANGNVDSGIFGYASVVINEPKALIKVTPFTAE